MPKLVPKNYVWEWQRNMFPYYAYLMAKGWLGFSDWPIHTVNICSQGVVNGYLDKELLSRAALKIINKVKNDNTYQQSWEAAVYRTGRELHKFCDDLSQIDLQKISDTQLLKVLRLSLKRFYYHNRQVVLIRVTNRLIQEILQRDFDSAAILTLLSATKKSFFISEHEDLLRLAEEIRRHKISQAGIAGRLEDHIRKYFYLPGGFYKESPLSVKDAKKNLAAIILNRETLYDFRQKIKKMVAARQSLLRKLHLEPGLQKIVDFGSLCTYFKDLIRANCNRWLYSQRKILQEIARRSGNNWELIAGLTPAEIEKLIKNPRKLQARGKIIFYSDGEGIHAALGNKFSVITNNFQKYFSAGNVKEIRGTTANRGKAAGRVLVIRNLKEARGQKDYILVATMTTPDLMPAVKNALAIVTDEGGLTCHAAIIARELGKPCIIGTKVATRVLHNGDLVEVDANRGIVRLKLSHKL